MYFRSLLNRMNNATGSDKKYNLNETFDQQSQKRRAESTGKDEPVAKKA